MKKTKEGWYLPPYINEIFINKDTLDETLKTVETYDGEKVELEYKFGYSSYARSLDRKDYGRIAIKYCD